MQRSLIVPHLPRRPFLLWLVSLALVAAIGLPIQSVYPLAGLALTEVVCILLPAVRGLRRMPVPQRRRLFGAVGWQVVLWSVLAGVSLWGLALIIFGAVGGTVVDTRNLVATPADWLLRITVVAVLPALCEELLFRGAIQGELEPSGRVKAVIINAMLFGVFHLDPLAMISTTLIGLMCGALVVRTGSLLPAILCHFGNNATGVMVAMGGLPLIPVAGWLACTLLVTAAGAWLATRHSSDSNLVAWPAPAPASRGARLGLAAALGLVAAVGVTTTAVDLERLPNGDLHPLMRAGQAVALVELTAARQARMGRGHVVGIGTSQPRRFGVIVRTEGDDVWLDSARGVERVRRSDLRVVVVYPRRGVADAARAFEGSATAR